jgi:hypothetical protein
VLSWLRYLQCILPNIAFAASLLSKNAKIKVQRTIMLPVVLYRYETWLIALREVRSLGIFENRVLRKEFGPKRDDITRELRRVHYEELYALYSLPNIIWMTKPRRLRWAGHVTRMV